MSRIPTNKNGRQLGLALVQPGTEPVSDKARGIAARKIRIGTKGDEMWLDWRINRQQYCVGYYDRAARTGRRISTGIGAGEGNDPPVEAHEALAARFAERKRPTIPQAAAEVGVTTILTRYLADHSANISAPERQAYAVQQLERFIVGYQRKSASAGVLTVDQLGKAFVTAFADHRRAEQIADSTIKRELSVLRAAINWAMEDEQIATKPHIPKLIGKGRLQTKPRLLAYNLPQIAALLEAAWRLPQRHHLHMFIMAMLSSHARVESVLECNLDVQYRDGVMDWLGCKEQTKKRRSIVPVAPTFANWLEGRSGKLIRYRVEIAQQRWKDPSVPEYHERETSSVKRAMENALVDAGAAHPSLKLRTPVLDAEGVQLTSTKFHFECGRKVGIDYPVWAGVGSSNTLRHSVHTQLRRIGVPKGQIDAAAGHAEQGTGENYNHFDAQHDLKDFVAGVEQLFDELKLYTTVHLRSHCGANVFDLAATKSREP